MRKALHDFSLTLFISFFFSGLIYSQDRFAYAMTDVNPTTSGWTVLRKLNFQTGVYSDALVSGSNPKFIAYDAASGNAIQPDLSTNYSPFSTGVAAIAYDKKNNRIYYTPMFIDQLRYVDLKTMKVYYVTDKHFTGLENPHNDEAKVVTRMVITPEGEGYAITNDATSFIRFNTGKNLSIQQLGSIVDDPANGGMSVHNRCSGWGGDIAADDQGNLYLFTASNSVFKINIQTKVAKWLGPVQGLPANFSINGIAVTDNGSLLAGSQVYSKNWYVIDPLSWKASEFYSPNGVYLTSDLANSNLLSTKRTEVSTIPENMLPGSDAIQLYPNPVSIDNNQFKIQFNKLEPGDYTVELMDVTGKQVMLQKLNVASEGQIQTVNLKKNTAQGIYLVKVTNINSKAIFTQKLVVQ